MSRNHLLLIVLAVDAVVILLGLSLGTKANRNFAEGGFVTLLSGLQLLIIAVLAWKTFRASRAGGSGVAWRSPAFIWFLIAAGFVFLALDELVQIHEHAKKAIYWLLPVKKSLLSDQLDNVIVIGYMVVGIAILFYYWRELIKYKRAIPLLCIGILLAGVMMAIDVVATLRMLKAMFPGKDRDFIVWLCKLLDLCEESVKVLASGVFVAVFYHCLQIARGLNPLPRLHDLPTETDAHR